ncbi:hypothetical protein Nepgr_019071 [Nepenthes gracilis]|uniref:Rotamase n=1 Tax=Nepenthes gracilis TaxID=150966 RepID=A0AAD3SUH4_NEPGR|nr:hypothetical protein Nepgr_019071 [Nepenthes gracilis]
MSMPTSDNLFMHTITYRRRSNHQFATYQLQDICKDGGIFKKIIAKGGKWENPKDLDEVLVKYEAQLEDGTLIAMSDGVRFTVNEVKLTGKLQDGTVFMRKGHGDGDELFEFKIEEEQVIEGLDRA